jgi:hypothetical protein
MGNCIRITVTVQPTLARDVHATQHQRPVVVGKSMNIKTLPNAKLAD